MRGNSTTPTIESSNSSSAVVHNLPQLSKVVGGGLALYQLTLRQHLHGRRWIVLTLLFLLPAALALMIRFADPDVPGRFLEFLLVWFLIPQAFLPLVALLYASGIIQDEQEDQTITYLLIRPISKRLIYMVKMLATWTTCVLLVVGLIVLTYAAIYARGSADPTEIAQRCLWSSAILSLAVVAYCSLFGLMSLLTRRVLVVGVVYAVIVEGLLATFPLSLRLATIVYYTRILGHRTLDFIVHWPREQQEDVAATAWLLDIKNDPTLAEHPQALTCILVLLTASIVCTLIGGWLCSRREFHVKTPERE
jgi:ABC-2 type transport system permease protein